MLFLLFLLCSGLAFSQEQEFVPRAPKERRQDLLRENRYGYFRVCFLYAADIAFLKQNRIRTIAFMGKDGNAAIHIANRSGEAFRKRINEEW